MKLEKKIKILEKIQLINFIIFIIVGYTGLGILIWLFINL
ncbi:hypothetical protein LCGC14_1115730 [marine sediment metagenome]|uniref:Uncharacterized protein n=1 Tax=marine sediment metagenome TaxID=412755 RepID=A0A0F9QB75_9ZZZZ